MSEYLSALARLFGAALFPKSTPSPRRHANNAGASLDDLARRPRLDDLREPVLTTGTLPPRAHAFDPQSFPGRPGQPWQEQAPAPKGAHYHYCLTPGCETALVCHAPADRCPVPDKWVCPTCELDAVDAYLTAQEREPR